MSWSIPQKVHLVAAALAWFGAAVASAAPPIRLHPDNPRWFEWRGKAVALITSAEHYGAVLNQDFEFHRYLEAMQLEGMNYTRIFAGSYVEPQGAFGIERNTLAPRRAGSSRRGRAAINRATPEAVISSTLTASRPNTWRASRSSSPRPAGVASWSN